MKRSRDLRPGEAFQESTRLAAGGIIDALSHDEAIAREMYANRFGAAPRHLDERAWNALRRAVERGDFVVVRLRPAPATAPRDWAAVPTSERLAYVMRLLVDTHHYPPNGAAGIVGNLYAESGVLPNRIEGSSAATPLRSANFAGQPTDFSPTEVMNRSAGKHAGPRLPGIGLAQWTSGTRRSGLFHRIESGHLLGPAVLFDMDAQVEYLVEELQARPGLNAALNAAGLTIDEASDDIVYLFEIPGTLLDASKHKRPRTDPAVQAEFARRRPRAHAAMRAFQAAHPSP